MATTNLQTQSLGNILVESGDGTPNHTSPKGSYYTNITTGSIFINNTGDSTGWEMLNKVAWGEMYIQSNTTNTTTTSPTGKPDPRPASLMNNSILKILFSGFLSKKASLMPRIK